MFDLNCSCFRGLTIKKLICCRRKEDKDIHLNVEHKNQMRKNNKKRNKNSKHNPSHNIFGEMMSFFEKLPANLDYEMLSRNQDTSISLVFNLEKIIISENHKNIPLIYGNRIDSLVGLSIADLPNYIPIGIVKMLETIINKVIARKTKAGILITIQDLAYVCVGFPVCIDEDKLLAVMIVKQPIDNVVDNSELII